MRPLDRPHPSRFCGLLLAALVAALLAPAGAAAQTMSFGRGGFSRPISFPANLIAPSTQIHPVDLFGGPEKEFVLVKDRTAHVFVLERNALREIQSFDLRVEEDIDGKTYYGFARLAPGAPYSMLLLTPRGIYQYPTLEDRIDPAPRLIQRKSLIQGQAGGSRVQYLDFAIDLNNDGVDELLIPESNGFSILRRTASGEFSPLSLPRNPYAHTEIFGFRANVPEDRARTPSLTGVLSQRRGVEDLLIFDCNGDGLQDLIYAQTLSGSDSRQVERFEVFLQGANLSFTKAPNQTLDVPFEPNSDITFRDINQDGRLDAIQVKSNYDLVNPKTIVRFFVSGEQAYQRFTRETDRFITKDPIGLVRVADFNNDGLVDFATTYFSYQFGSADDIVDLAVKNQVRFRLQFYLGGGARGFARRPDYDKELTISLKSDTYRGYPPVLLTDDMNGDGITDLVVRTAEDRIAVYFSNNGRLSYPNTPIAEFSIPADAGIECEDLNADGRADLLITSYSRQTAVIYLATAR